MGSIEVEAVEDATRVDAPEYVLYGGKGGVGKTTCAAATALASAREGTPTLVVSTDPAHSLADTLETPVPAEPARIREDVPLYAAEIDPEAAVGEGPFGMDGGLGDLLGGSVGGLGDSMGGLGVSGEDVGDGGLFGPDADPLAGSMPGADEAAALRLLLEYMEDDRFERVVLDTAPTGHTLRLLELPEAMDSLLGRLLTLRERLSGLFEGMGGLFGDESDVEVNPDAADDGFENLEVLRERIERLRERLRDPRRTDFRVVVVPEELAVVEAQRLVRRLDDFGIPVRTIVVNRVLQDLESVATVDPEHAPVGPNREECAFCARRWEVQQRAIDRAQELFQGHDVRRVPLLAEEVRGDDLLGVVAACLED